MTVSRRQARLDAMVILYQRELTGSSSEDLLTSLADEQEHDVDPFTRDTVATVVERSDELDRIIDRHSRDWTAKRMSSLERNILRIAVNEIVNDEDIPFEVSIDEAVGLSKRYCSREAAALINGILGQLAGEAVEDDSDDIRRE
jgi:N utilization substance protein B